MTETFKTTEQEPADHQMPINEWLAARKRAGLEIDPHTAEVKWCFGYVIDPYGVHADLKDEEGCIGRVYFARNPGSDIWVAYYDLPKETVGTLAAHQFGLNWGQIDSLDEN